MATKERTHFARIFTAKQCRDLIKQLDEVTGRKTHTGPLGDSFAIHAPDGDLVFAGLRHSGGRYLCRLHREVFDERA